MKGFPEVELELAWRGGKWPRYMEQKVWLLVFLLHQYPNVEHCSVPFTTFSLHVYCVSGPVLSARSLQLSRECQSYREIPRRLIWVQYARLKVQWGRKLFSSWGERWARTAEITRANSKRRNPADAFKTSKSEILISEIEENWGVTSSGTYLCQWGGWVLILPPVSGQYQASFSTSSSGGLICITLSPLRGREEPMWQWMKESLIVRYEHSIRIWCFHCTIWKIEGTRIKVCLEEPVEPGNWISSYTNKWRVGYVLNYTEHRRQKDE